MTLEVISDDGITKYLFEGPNNISIRKVWNREMPRIAMLGSDGFAITFDPQDIPNTVTGTLHVPFDRCEHVALDNLLRLNERTSMKCPDCTDGKITLLFDVIECERCGGKGVLRTEDKSTLRFDGSRFRDPRPLKAAFAYEGCIPQDIHSEQELFDALGVFERIQILEINPSLARVHNSDWEILGQTWSGRTRDWKLRGDGDAPADMIHNFAFVKNWIYSNHTVIAEEIIGEFLKQSTVGDKWTQLQPSTPLRYAAQYVFGGHESPQSLRKWLHASVRDLISEIEHDPRGKCWSTEVNDERDNHLAVSVDRDGYGCTVQIDFDNMRDQVQIGWTTRV